MSAFLRACLRLGLAFCLALVVGRAGKPGRAWFGLYSSGESFSTILGQANGREGRILLRMKESRGAQAVAAYFKTQGLQPLGYLSQIDVWVLEAASLQPDQILESLKNAPSILWVEQDGWLHASEVIPDDDFYQAQQGNLAAIGLPEAWVYTTGGSDWPIAVVDTGVDLDHPDLEAKIWTNPDEIPDNDLDDDDNGYVDDVQGWNFVLGNAIPQDDSSHGSHVAGIAAAHTNNLIGVAGVAWQTPIMPLKALNASGDGQASDIAAAILYAADNGARVINLSLGDDQEYQTITDAVAYARSLGCLLVAAVGNGSTAVEYPAATQGVLAVASSDNAGIPSVFSNRGPEVDLVAPGEDIFSANKSNSYTFMTGTSMSTPHVSGLAALVWSLRPEWTAVQVSQVITCTAEDVWSPGRDYLTGWGFLDAQAAVKGALYKIYFPLIWGGADGEAKLTSRSYTFP
jgi:subtilisin family serine protease